MADNHGTSKETAHKLLRVARVHFHRQTVAATGPRLMHRQQMFHALMANPSVKKIIDDEVNNKRNQRRESKTTSAKNNGRDSRRLSRVDDPFWRASIKLALE